MGQLKKFEIKIFGTNDVPEEQIDIPEVKRNEAGSNTETTNNWPGVNPKLELPFPKYQYIGKLKHTLLGCFFGLCLGFRLQHRSPTSINCKSICTKRIHSEYLYG